MDIAVCLSEDKDITEKRLEILGELMDILKTDEIDLVILNAAPISLRMKNTEEKTRDRRQSPLCQTCL